MKTVAAQCAAAIRKDLKQAFPGVKFSVTSSSFSGGNAVDVRYFDAVLVEGVRNIVDKYQYGTFNGMEDIYEYTNRRDDIPQVMYAMVHRRMSQEVKKAIATKLFEKFQVATVEDFMSTKMIHIAENYSLYAPSEISKEFNQTIF